jgi:hypothetical protein
MVWQALIAPITGLLDKVIPDADERARLAYEINTLAEKQHHSIMQGQMEVNKAEAESPSIFKGGWRPWIGWVCGSAFALNFLLFPMMQYGLEIAKTLGYLTTKIPPPPVLDMATMMPVMLGMLGLAINRTAEKIKGVAAK